MSERGLAGMPPPPPPSQDEPGEAGGPRASALRVVPNEPARPGRRWRWLRRLLLVGVVFPTLVLGGLYVMLNIEPQAVRAQRVFLEQTEAEEIETMAQDVEDRLHATFGLAGSRDAVATGPFSRRPGGLIGLTGANPGDHGPEAADGPRPSSLLESEEAEDDKGGPRTLFVTPEEINAWLSQKLGDWMESRGYQMPPSIQRPMVALAEDRLLLSFEVHKHGLAQQFSAGCDLRFLPDGQALLKIDNLQAGSVPVAVEDLGGYLQQRLPATQEVERLGEWLAKLENLRFKPVLRLKAHKRALLTHYRILAGGLELTLEMEDRASLYGQPSFKSTTPRIPSRFIGD